jgi:hypothetical protein
VTFILNITISPTNTSFTSSVSGFFRPKAYADLAIQFPDTSFSYGDLLNAVENRPSPLTITTSIEDCYTLWNVEDTTDPQIFDLSQIHRSLLPNLSSAILGTPPFPPNLTFYITFGYSPDLSAILFQLFCSDVKPIIFSVLISGYVCGSSWGLCSPNQPVTIRLDSATFEGSDVRLTNTSISYKLAVWGIFYSEAFGCPASSALAPETFCVTDQWQWAHLARNRCATFLRMGKDDFAELYLQNTGGADELDLRALDPNAKLPEAPIWGNESEEAKKPIPKSGGLRVLQESDRIDRSDQSASEPIFDWKKMGKISKEISIFKLLDQGAKFFWFDSQFAMVPTHATPFAPLAMTAPRCVVVRSESSLLVLVEKKLKIENEKEGGYLYVPMAKEGVLEPVFLKVKDSEQEEINIKKEFSVVADVLVPVSAMPEIIEGDPGRDLLQIREDVILRENGNPVSVKWFQGPKSSATSPSNAKTPPGQKPPPRFRNRGRGRSG